MYTKKIINKLRKDKKQNVEIEISRGYNSVVIVIFRNSARFAHLNIGLEEEITLLRLSSKMQRTIEYL